MGNFDPDNEIEAFRAGIWRLNVHADARAAASAGSRCSNWRPRPGPAGSARSTCDLRAATWSTGLACR